MNDDEQDRRLAELSARWWRLTEEDRAEQRKKFMARYETDPVFLTRVWRLLWGRE
jgi:hypothetical protein